MRILSIEDRDFLNQLTEIAEANLADDKFGVNELSRKMGKSRSAIHRRLKKTANKSVSEFICDIRLEKAKAILMSEGLSVSEVAYEVGFGSPSYFNRVFRKHFNMSPGEFKKCAFAEQTQADIHEKESNFNSFEGKSSKDKRKKVAFAFFIGLIGILICLWIIFFKPSEKSIAVLPLNNLTASIENNYFVDGIHDALIGELGKLGKLRVISRKSTIRYRQSEMLLSEIAKELGVNTIVEGSVLGVGDSIQILIQLIDVFPKERHILATEYNEALENVLTLQSSAVFDIARKINVKLSKREKEQLAQTRTVNPETYKAYLRGMYHINLGTPESFKKGIDYLLEAIDKDPGDPFAYAALALGYANIGHGQLEADEAFLRAESAAKTAIKIDPTIDEAHTALSILYLYRSWEWEKARKAFESSLEQNPNNELAHAHFAWYYVLFGDFEKAIYHGKKAAELNPLYVSYMTWLALIYYHNKDYDEAEIWAEKAIQVKDKTPYGNLAMGLVCLKTERYKEAILFHEKLPKWDKWKVLCGYAYWEAGQKEKAREVWGKIEEKAKTKKVHPYYRSMIAAYLGDADKAFELLNETWKQKKYPITYLATDRWPEDFKNDPRFNDLLKKMNLPVTELLFTEKQ